MNNVQDYVDELNEIQRKLDKYEKQINEIEQIVIKIRAKCDTQVFLSYYFY